MMRRPCSGETGAGPSWGCMRGASYPRHSRPIAGTGKGWAPRPRHGHTDEVDALDDALERLAGTAPEFGPGLSNHGPMAAEALVRLGHADDVAGWVDRYRARLEPGPPPGRPLAGDEWQEALGDPVSWPDWVATFDRQLAASAAVADVVAGWVPRLAPGSIAAATHGLIRTAHAVRSLEHDDTPRRRHELAEALAYWAARYQELPGPPVLIGSGDVPATLAGLPQLPEEAPDELLITDRVRHVDMIVTPFEQAVAALAPPRAVPAALDALGVGGARAYLANAGRGHEIALVHSVTGPLALQLLLGSLRPSDHQTVFAYVWQAVASIHVAYAVDRVPPGPPPAGEELPDVDELVALAVASGDEHAIKLTEASLRAYARTPQPVLLAAAADLACRAA